MAEIKEFINKYKIYLIIIGIIVFLVVAFVFENMLSSDSSGENSDESSNGGFNFVERPDTEFQFEPDQSAGLFQQESESYNFYFNSENTTQAQALAERYKLDASLPIFIEATQPRMTLVVTTSEASPNYVIYIDTTGINYFENNSNPDPEVNFHARRFIILFEEALSRIRQAGGNPSKMVFKFTNKAAFEEVAIEWIEYNKSF